MAALDIREIPSAGHGIDRDQFELFARDFLQYRGYRIVDGPDRGADGGRDLIVEEPRRGPGGITTIRWLVSCKHYAHSGKSVSIEMEQNIRDRLGIHKCGGFMGVYSTIPSSGLRASLNGLRDFCDVVVYDPSDIEKMLLEHFDGHLLASRYMPTSFSRWMHISGGALAKHFATRPSNSPHETEPRRVSPPTILADSTMTRRSKIAPSAFEFIATRTEKNRLPELSAALERSREVKMLLVGGSALIEQQLPRKAFAQVVLPRPDSLSLGSYAETVGDEGRDGLWGKITKTTRYLLDAGVTVRWCPHFIGHSIIIADAKAPDGWAQQEIVLPFAPLANRSCLIFNKPGGAHLITALDEAFDRLFSVSSEPSF